MVTLLLCQTAVHSGFSYKPGDIYHITAVKKKHVHVFDWL